METVTVLIVTYNRSDCLIKLLKSLLIQSYKLERIVIFDNNSTDKTTCKLQKNGYIKSSIVEKNKLYINKKDNVETIYLKSSKNTGGSGGFYSGMKMANSFGSDYIWCMDDDVLPDEGCLNEMLSSFDKNVGIVIPNRSDNYFSDNAIVDFNLKNPFLFRLGMQKRIISSSDIGDNSIEVVDMPFEGPLIKSDIINKVGYPNKDFFILFDDTEYAYRCRKYGLIIFNTRAHLHRQIRPVVTFPKKKRMNWKDYYFYRNQFFFEKKYGENFAVRNVRNFFLVIDLSVRAIALRKWSNLRIIYLAYLNGVAGNLGDNFKGKK
ncbi:glycosyltransferase [Lactobacillus sp. UCMA15818]|uniref:glycosyltransferase n=1 Tax=Lactobacillus sp. UCMA15818 TaxID=2583394 RepID=UPI0025AF5658|nr:glycosyltransferase [Lactobacillus sp. UCMA15818]MDN2452993.1 glycosyltransferase [Lactobacillus sp. UCMA15818]